MDAEIIIRAVAKNVCEPAEIIDSGFANLQEMVEFLVDENGILDFMDEYVIVSVKEISASDKTGG